jgi:hypothetical protein
LGVPMNYLPLPFSLLLQFIITVVALFNISSPLAKLCHALPSE